MASALLGNSTYRSRAFLILGLLLSGYLQWDAVWGDYANGWDAYFYLVQVKSWLETGQMHSPEWSVFYPFLAVIYYLTDSYETAYQLLSILAKLALLYLVWDWLQAWSPKKEHLFGVWAFLVWSPSLTYVFAQYPKNGLGFVCLFLFMRYWRKEKVVFTMLFFLLTLFSHRLAAGLVIIGLTLWGLERGAQKVGDNRLSLRRLSPWITLSLGILLLSLFSGLLHWSDWERLHQFWQTNPRWIPYGVGHYFSSSFPLSNWWWLEIGLHSILLLFLGLSFFRMGIKSWVHGFVLLVCGMAVWPFWILDTGSIGLRLALWLPVFSVLALGPWVQRIPGSLSIVLGGLFFVLSLFTGPAYQKSLFEPSYHSYARLGGLAESWFSQQIPEKFPELIIAPKGIAEYWTFRFGWDVMPWLPEYTVPSERLYRLGRGPWGNDLNYYLPAGTVHRLGTQTFLLLEKDWQTFLRSLQETGEEELLLQIDHWQNPAAIRPEYLLRRQRNR